MLSSTSCTWSPGEPGLLPELEASVPAKVATEGWGAVQSSGPGPARRGEAPWLDGRMWAGLPSPEGEAIKGGGKKGGAAGGKDWGGREEREGGKREGRSRCERVVLEGGKARARGLARKLGEFGIRAERPQPKTPLQPSLSIWSPSLMGFLSKPSWSLQRSSLWPSTRFIAAV